MKGVIVIVNYYFPKVASFHKDIHYIKEGWITIVIVLVSGLTYRGRIRKPRCFLLVVVEVNR